MRGKIATWGQEMVGKEGGHIFGAGGSVRQNRKVQAKIKYRVTRILPVPQAQYLCAQGPNEKGGGPCRYTTCRRRYTQMTHIWSDQRGLTRQNPPSQIGLRWVC